MAKNKVNLESMNNKVIQEACDQYNNGALDLKGLVVMLNSAAKGQDTVIRTEDVKVKETLAKKEFNLKQEEFEYKKEQDEKTRNFEMLKYENQRKLELERFNMENKKMSNEVVFRNNELTLRERELALREAQLAQDKKSDTLKTVVNGIAVLVPSALSLVGTLVGIKYHHQLATMSLNMEYIDNMIAPRTFTDAANSVKQYLKK